MGPGSALRAVRDDSGEAYIPQHRIQLSNSHTPSPVLFGRRRGSPPHASLRAAGKGKGWGWGWGLFLFFENTPTLTRINCADAHLPPRRNRAGTHESLTGLLPHVYQQHSGAWVPDRRCAPSGMTVERCKSPNILFNYQTAMRD